MTHTMDHPGGAAFGRPAARPASGAVLWSLADLSILVGALTASGDLLVNLGPLQQLVWLYCYGLTLMRIAMQWPSILPVLMGNRALMLFPAVCLVSVLWSLTKSFSLVTGVQLAMTMLIGLYLGWRYTMAALLKALVAVMSVGVALSLLHWATGVFPWPVYTRVGGLAGLFSGKNMLGMRALFGLTGALAILLMVPRDAGRGIRLVAVGALLLNGFALLLSLSITSILLAPPVLGLLLVMSAHRVPKALAALASAVAIAALALGPLVAIGLLGIDPVEALLTSVGKSSTLTGRTDLWAIARDVWLGAPLLGYGYRAFWQAPGFANTRYLTEEAGAVTSASFHNFPLEILVSAGIPGLLAMAILLWVAIRRMARAYGAGRSVPMAAGLALMVGIIVSSLLGTSLYRGHEIMMVLTVAFAVTAGETLRHRRRRGADADP